MNKDPTNQFIKNVLENCDINDKIILEVGCGDGRVTRDLSQYARKVVGVEPDDAKLQKAKSEIVRDNVDFIRMRGESLCFPENLFDVVIYVLSLHHIPINKMNSSLTKAAEVIKRNGKIIIIEPCKGGTLIEAEEKFGVGDGNEQEEKMAAKKAIHSLEGWTTNKSIFFETLFYFHDEQDFFENLVPDYIQKPKKLIEKIEKFLIEHRNGNKIILTAERRMNVLIKQTKISNEE